MKYWYFFFLISDNALHSEIKWNSSCSYLRLLRYLTYTGQFLLAVSIWRMKFMNYELLFKCLIRRKQIEQQEMVPKTDSLGIETNILFQRINVDTFLLRKSVNLQKISTEHIPII